MLVIKKLYHLIWTNTLESCMADAIFNIQQINISAPFDSKYKHQEEQVLFPGWLIIKGYIKENNLFKYIKSLQEGEIEYKKVISKQGLKNLKQHYTEARLVQLLEKKGIGRPSTFSSLITKIQERNYVKKEDVKGKEINCKEYILEGDELEEKEVKKTFGNERNKLVLQSTGLLVIQYLLKNFDDLFKYEYTEKMEQRLDNISDGNGIWQELCRDCDKSIGEKLKTIKKMNKDAGITIDEHHTYMVGKWGPYVKCDIDGEITYKKVKKNLNIDQMKQGEINLESILEKELNGKILGLYNEKSVVLKDGKYGLYVSWNDKNYSIKNLGKGEDDIVLDDVIDILSGKKSSNPNVLKILNENISIRKGKYGSYIFYKTERMSKPKFIQMRKVFENEDNKRWQDYSILELIRLVKDCL